MAQEILERVKAIDYKQTELHRALLICQKTVNDNGNLSYALKNAISNVCLQAMEMSREMVNMRTSFNEFQTQLNSTEQLSLKNSIEIQGIPYRQDESILGIVVNVCRVLEVKIGESNIDYAYRVTNNGPADPSRPAPIVVRFVRSLTAERLVKAKRLKGNISTDALGLPNCPTSLFYINFRLTAINRKIFSRAWLLKKRGIIKHVWTTHGKIFARRGDNTDRVRIRNIHDLESLHKD
ncbi:uncharacterized protein LOC124170954 [Ischnura elegans]|uniref:uncharacterized protein LOC124170954 n=1 Tax=Ischnura elegans TaxID=197161 RepID=UPI001ED89C43|nr:uncharacterized protein LOC124170954 [Ischnura elegans]